jgi:hypothetical protein
MHQGRLYVFDSFICFYSNVFGVERKKIIALQSVTAILRAKTALVVPNAIEIVTMGDRRDFFASFITLDKAYRLMCAAWCNNTPLAVEFFRRQKEERDEKERAAAAPPAPAIQAAPPPPPSEPGAAAAGCMAEPEDDPMSRYEHPGGVIMRRATAPPSAPVARLVMMPQTNNGSSTNLVAAGQAASGGGDSRGLFGTIGALFKSEDGGAQPNGGPASELAGHSRGISSMGSEPDFDQQPGDSSPDGAAAPQAQPLAGDGQHLAAGGGREASGSTVADAVPPSPPAGDPPPPGSRHVRVFSDGSDADADSLASLEKLGAAPVPAQPVPAPAQPQGRSQAGFRRAASVAVATTALASTNSPRRPSAADLLELVTSAEQPRKHAYVAPPASGSGSVPPVPAWSKGMRVIQEVDLDVSLEGLVQAVWSDEAAVPGGFAASVHASRQETELRISPWQPASSGGFQRDVMFRSPIRGPSARFGKSSTYCHVSQHCRRHGPGDFVLQSSQVMNDIPYGDYFRVQFRWDVTAARGDVNHCRLRVGVEVVFLKSTFLKGTIESNTFSETSDSVKDWIAAMKKLVASRAMQASEQQDDYEGDDEGLAATAPPGMVAQAPGPTPGTGGRAAQHGPRTPRGSVANDGSGMERTPHTGASHLSGAFASPFSGGMSPALSGMGALVGGAQGAESRGGGGATTPLAILAALLLSIVAYLLGAGGLSHWSLGASHRGGYPYPGGGMMGGFYPPPFPGGGRSPYSQQGPSTHWDAAGSSAAWLAGMDAYAASSGAGGGASAVGQWERRAQAMRDELEALDRRLAFLRTELAVAERKAAEWKLREADEQLAQAKAQAQATSGTPHQA